MLSPFPLRSFAAVRCPEDNTAIRLKTRSQDLFRNNPGPFRPESASACVVSSRRSYSDSGTQLVPVV